MRAIAAIARNTFREAIRDRILYLFIGFAVVLLAASKLFGMLTVGDEGKIVKDVGLAAIQFFAMLISVMMSVLLISREVERRTVFNILATPVRRSQFVLGKFLGLLATTTANLVLMTIVLLVVVRVFEGEVDLKLVVAAAMILLEMAVLTAFATLFSVVTKPILGSMMTLAVFVVGHLTEDLWLLTRHLRGTAGRALIAVLYYLLPNLERFNFKTEAVHDLAIPPPALAWAVVYGLTLTALALVLACVHFERKDLA